MREITESVTMSEPLSTPEIEDVVSSVRRLVSTTLSPRVKTRDLSHDKLILTPSLRVVPDVAREPEPPAEAAPVAEAEPSVATTADLVPEAPFIEVEPIDALPEATLHLVEAEWEDELWTEDEAPLAELAAAVEDAEIVVSTDAEPLDDSWPEVAATPDPWGQAEPDWMEEAPIPFAPLPDAEAATVAAEVPAPLVAETGAPTEAAVAADPGLSDAPQTEAAVAKEPTLFDEDGSPLAILDEEQLNEIVRALIREELQGALGERITRNVRKLVRTEINRALAARAFD